MTFLWTLSQMMIVSQGRWSLLNIDWKSRVDYLSRSWLGPQPSHANLTSAIPPAPLHVHGQARNNAKHAGKSLPMRHPEKEGKLCCCVRLHAATNIGIDVPTCLGEDSPRKVGQAMLMHVAARTRMHRHRFPYFSGRRAAQTSRGIYADACGCMEPHALA